MEGSESAKREQGDQMAAPMEANGLAGQEAHQLAARAEKDSSANNGKNVHLEAHEHIELSTAEIDTEPARRSDMETLTEATSSLRVGEAHEQVASDEAKGPAQNTEVAEVTPNMEICATCLQQAQVKCAQCKSTWYCSRECQRIDWTFHKHLCREFKNFQTRPEPNSVRAIFFPEDEKAPRFVWLKQNDEPLDLGYVHEKFEPGEVEELLLVTEEEVSQQFVTRSIRRDRRQDEVTARGYLLVRRNSFADGSKPNMSVGWVTKGNFQFSWRGPMVAVLTRFDESEENEDEAVLDDISVLDFRDLIDFFGIYGHLLPGHDDFGALSFWWLSQSLRDELERQHQIKVVQVASDLENKHIGTKFQQREIGAGSPAFAYVQPCPVTSKLGLPLVLRRIPVDDIWKEEAEAKGDTNHGAHLLLLDVDPKSPLWGTPPGFLQQGTVLLMRQDGKDLHAHHVEAIIMYLLQVVQEAMKESSDGGRSKAEVLELMHPSRLDWYFNRYRKEKAEEEESWKDSPPMFDILAPPSERGRLD
ncbi:MAG: hypothetical protein Q9226_006301 [Calogaya cf. arnoldii]